MRTMTSRSPSCTSVLGVLFAALLGISASSVSNSVGAGDAAHFLRSGIGAHALGMGGAFVAVADDATVGYWNPAGLCQTASVRLNGTYESRYNALLEFQYLGAALFSPTLGFGLVWAHSGIYSVYLVSVAALAGTLAVGINGKVYDFSASGQRGGGVGLDVAGFYSMTLGETELAIGGISSDIGWSDIQWRGEGYFAKDHVAWVTRLGAALSSPFAPAGWQCAASLEVVLRRPPRQGESSYLSTTLETGLCAGVEVRLDWVSFRAGLADIGLGRASESSIHPTLGVGVQGEGLAVDAAWAPSPLGDSYLVSVEFQF